MTAWIVILAILAFLFLISLIRFKITIEYNEELNIYLRVMHIIRIPITPRKEKKLKLSSYSEKAIAKRDKKNQEKEERKAQKKLAKKQQKQEKKKRKKEHPEESKPKRSLSENLSLILDVVKVLFSRFFKHLRIDLSRIHISLVGEDAAQTAILYGVVCQSVAYLLELMKSLRTVSPPDLSDVSVTPDWVGEKTQIDIKISFSMRVGNVFDIIGRVIGRAVSHLFRDMKNKQKQQNSPMVRNHRPPTKKTPARSTKAPGNRKSPS